MRGGNPEDDATQATSPAYRTEDPGGGGLALYLQGLGCEPAYVPLDATRLVFGRGSSCDVQLSGSEVSRHHAEIVQAGPVLLLRDLGSTNGTFLNGERLGEATLVPGALVRMGEWLACLREGSEASVRPSPFSMQGPGLWGSSALNTALAPLRAVAESTLPIVLEGETGTGKELVARAVHAWSGRAGAFVAINCAALPESLAEAELFGYRRGAFTGADRANPGYFRAAHGGSLLLDEVCDLPAALQVKLLRVLEQREVVPLGESQPAPVDVRILAAAQEPLRRAVEERRFRADLYARLNGLSVRLPPLRERVEDIPRLLEHFMAEYGGMQRAPRPTTNALEALLLHDWPFNVRELRLVAQRVGLLRRDDACIHRRDLPESLRSRTHPVPADGPRNDRAERIGSELERLVAALRIHRGNVAQAARVAGMSRMRAYRVMNAHPDISVESFRAAAKAEP